MSAQCGNVVTSLGWPRELLEFHRVVMRVRGAGYWELFIPQAGVGDHYKFDIIEPDGQHLPLKSDPFAFAAEALAGAATLPPRLATVTHRDDRLAELPRADC